MMLTMITPQYLAGYSALLAVVASAGCYAWVAPIMNYLLDPNSDMYMTSSKAAFMLAIPEFGELIMCLPAGMMADKYGRKVCILTAGPMFAVCWSVTIFWKSYYVLCTMRIIQGMAVALTFAVVPLYLGEISSPSQRGSLTGLFSFSWYLGYVIEYCVGPFVSYQTFILFTASVPVIFTVTFMYQPESPYYLIMKGRIEEATATLKWLRKGSDEEHINNELEEIKDSIMKELTIKPSWKDIIETPADRRALLIIYILGGTWILSGGVALQSYSTILFSESGTFFLSPDALTIFMGFALLFGGIVNAFIVDLSGRRPLLFISCLGSFIPLFIIGIYFYLKEQLNMNVSSYGWMVPTGVILYGIFSVIGLYPILMTYTSELFTTKTRGKAASLSAINLTVCSFICIELYQIIGETFGLFVVFFFFAAVCLFGLMILYVIAPETKGQSFSQIRSDILNTRKTKTITNVAHIKQPQESNDKV